jgi:spore maturation protein CgeB
MNKIFLAYFNLDGFAVAILTYIREALSDLGIPFRLGFIKNRRLFLSTHKDFNPHITVFFHPSFDLADYADLIHDLPGHKMVWDMEGPYESDVIAQNHHLFGYIFTQDRATADHYRVITADPSKVIFVPHACLPSVHSPVVPSYDYRSDFLFIGNAFQSRLEFFERHATFFSDYLLTVIGIGYPTWAAYSHQRIMNIHVEPREYVRYTSGAKVVLNIHRLNSDLDMRNSYGVRASSPNNRLFEVACLGRPQLVDASRCPEIFDYFDEDEIQVFYSPEDFEEKASFLISNPHVARTMGEKARRRALEHHTYHRRLEDFLLRLLR